MSEHYTVIHNGENLYSYKMNLQEKEIVEAFRLELIDICDRLDIPRTKRMDGSLYMGRLLDDEDFVLKYKADVGFIVLYGERGVFQMGKEFPTLDREQAKLIMLKTEFQSGGFTYELNLRKTLEIAWKERYKGEYDSRKAAFEFAIKMLMRHTRFAGHREVRVF